MAKRKFEHDEIQKQALASFIIPKQEVYPFNQYIGDSKALINRLNEIIYPKIKNNWITQSKMFFALNSPTASGKTVSTLINLASEAETENSLFLFFAQFTSNWEQEAQALIDNELYEGIRNKAVALGKDLDPKELHSDISIIILTPDRFVQFQDQLETFITNTGKRIISAIDESHVMPLQAILRGAYKTLKEHIKNTFHCTFFITATHDKVLNSETAKMLGMNEYIEIKCIRKNCNVERVNFKLKAEQPPKDKHKYSYLQYATDLIENHYKDEMYSIETKERINTQMNFIAIMNKRLHYQIGESVQKHITPDKKNKTYRSFRGDNTKQSSKELIELSVNSGVLPNFVENVFATSVLYQGQSINNENLKRYQICTLRSDTDLNAKQHKQIMSRGRDAVKNAVPVDTDIYLPKAFVTKKIQYPINEKYIIRGIYNGVNGLNEKIGISPIEQSAIASISGFVSAKVNLNDPISVSSEFNKIKMKLQNFEFYLYELAEFYFPDQTKFYPTFETLQGERIPIRDQFAPAKIGSIIGVVPKLKFTPAYRVFDLSEFVTYATITSEDEIRQAVLVKSDKIKFEHTMLYNNTNIEYEKMKVEAENFVCETLSNKETYEPLRQWLKEVAKDYQTTGYIVRDRKIDVSIIDEKIECKKVVPYMVIDECLKFEKINKLLLDESFDTVFRIYKNYSVDQIKSTLKVSESVLLRLLISPDGSVSNSYFQKAKSAVMQGNNAAKTSFFAIEQVGEFLITLQENSIEQSKKIFTDEISDINEAIRTKNEQIRVNKSRNKAKHQKELYRLKNRKKAISKAIERRENSAKIGDIFNELKELKQDLKNTTLNYSDFQMFLKFTNCKFAGDFVSIETTQSSGKVKKDNYIVKRGEMFVPSDIKFDFIRQSEKLGISLENLFFKKYSATLSKIAKQLSVENENEAANYITERIAGFKPAPTSQAPTSPAPNEKSTPEKTSVQLPEIEIKNLPEKLDRENVPF